MSPPTSNPAELSASEDIAALAAGLPSRHHGVGLLQEQVRLLKAVVDNFPGGISVFDKDLKMVLCNDQQKRLLDYPDNMFASGYPTLEDIYRFNAIRGEYGPGDTEAQ